jgi:malonyl-CoA/methylmalonyl-CoA synthetase
MRDPNHLSSALLAHARPAATFARLQDGRTLTYADLIALSDRISAKLLSIGLAPGDRVGRAGGQIR